VLKFSKINILITTLLSIIVIFFTISNFTEFEDEFVNKKINLGLDLQGGSYLLLKIDNDPVIIKELQNKAISLKNVLKENNINVLNIRVTDDKKILLSINKKDADKLNQLFNDKNGIVNPYFDQFKSFQFEIANQEENFEIFFSKYGLIQLKTSSLDQAIEIVRRRVDEVGTNEPNILKRGNDRILVELPGLDDPMRIKNLLGKTANLSFRFVTQTNEETFGSEELEFEDGSEVANVSKRIIVSGENLVDAQPRMDNQTNETVVTFDFDRVGAKRFGRATTKGVGKRLAIVLDGKVISAPVIQEAIVAGSGQITGDFTDPNIKKKIKENFNKRLDVVMSDMAVNTTGIKNLDAIQTGELCKEAMIFSKDIISQNGFFISKIFMGSTFNEIVALGKKIFKEVKVFKPQSSRKDSKESFIICKKIR